MPELQPQTPGSLGRIGSVVGANSESLKTRKIMVITVHVRDYELLKEMLASGQEKLPDLTMEGVVSAIVADACRFHRQKVNLPTET